MRGADIETITSESKDILIKDDSAGRYVETDGTITMSLKNLASNSNIVLAFKNENGMAHPDITLPIERAVK